LNFRHVFALPIDEIPMLDQLLAEMPRHVPGFGSETRHAFNHVHCQMETIEPVEHDHVEWSRRRTFLVESPHMHVFMIFSLIGQTMNERRYAPAIRFGRLVHDETMSLEARGTRWRNQL
jgi:hypothetical protein